MKITLDKGNYAFITGEMIQTESITAEDVFTSGVDIANMDIFKSGNYAGSDYIVRENNQEINRIISIFIKSNNKVEEIIKCYSNNEYKYRFLHLNLVLKTQFIDITLLRLRYTNISFLDANKLLDYCVNLLSMNFYKFEKLVTDRDAIVIYSNKIIELNVMGYDSEIYKFYYTITNDIITELHLNADIVTSNFKVTKTLTKKDISDYCIENHIALYVSSLYDVTMYSDAIAIKMLHCFNTDIEIKVFRGSNYNSSSISDTDKKAVDESWTKLESLRGKLAKSCGSKNLDELRKLTPINILTK